MRSWMNTNAAPQRIGLLLFDDFSMHCLANTVEPFRAANTLSGRALYVWSFLSLDGQSVTSSSGLEVRVHGALTDAGGDVLFILPSYRFRDHATNHTARALRSATRRFPTLAGLDTGSWLMAAAGLLDGYRATIHWEELGAFSESFPELEATRARHVIDRDRITCGGALAAFDLVLELIEDRHGAALRLEVATLFMSPQATGPQAAPTARSRSVARAIALMQENLEAPLRLPDLARRIGRPLRDLEKRMQTEVGAPPQTVYRRLRLIEARKIILETELAMSEVALRTGYEDPSALTRAFRQEFGVTPRQLRSGKDTSI